MYATFFKLSCQVRLNKNKWTLENKPGLVGAGGLRGGIEVRSLDQGKTSELDL